MVLYSYTAPSNFLFSQTQQWHRAYFAAIRKLRTIWRTITEAGRVRFRGHRLHVSGKYFSTDCIFIQPHRMFPIGLGKVFHIGQVPVSGTPPPTPPPLNPMYSLCMCRVWPGAILQAESTRVCKGDEREASKHYPNHRAERR